MTVGRYESLSASLQLKARNSSSIKNTKVHIMEIKAYVGV
jgi:hypothetical protein